MKQLTPHQLKSRLVRLAEERSRFDTRGAQIRGPVWTGPKPRTLPFSAGYTPAHAEANQAIDEKNYGFGVIPGSGLSKMLGLLGRADRRLLLAAIQTTNLKRRARLQARFQRRAAALGLQVG